MLLNAGVIGASAGGGAYDPDAQAYIDRLTGTYSGAELDAINQLFVDLKSAVTTFSRFQYFHICWLDNASDAVLDAMGNTHRSGGYPLTRIGTTFTAREGISTNGTTDYINTGWNPRSNAAGGAGTNSMTIGCYARSSNYGTNRFLFGGYDSTVVGEFWLLPSDGSCRVNSGSIATFAALATAGAVQLTRRGSSDVELYINSTSLGTSTIASTNTPNVPLWYGARNAGGSFNSTFSAPVSNQFGATWALDGISSTEAANIAAAFEACADAFGAGVV